ncbi:hypothetical protein [Bosea sp. (in: a-proteobacteria)]|uniref:VpaChn25_0724 family phage protein n=1 Tax=Bosea sp. (in: a-proteobacteria) TaxID=1871050 RepID=UPI0027374C00|nr:hypothetical protein [Bosea sp. (in: a-proteobacteria)]MDP3408204.1 hypothetical protein [Bosea sp. (in: a-proteobacteria)]
MSSLAETFARDRRLVILRLLSEQDGYALSANMLTKAVRQMRHSVYDDTIAADLVMLEQHALIQRDEERHGQKTIVVATLTRLGQDVAGGRPHPIVDQPSPKF